MDINTKEQIGTFVTGLIEFQKPPKPTLASRMRYQRALLREVLIFWPTVNPTDVVTEIIGPMAGNQS